jgi:Protein of unknown function (DUF2971)
MTSLFYHLKNADEFAYHYTGPETLVKHILPTDRIRFSRFTQTNDPRECKDWTSGLHTIGDFGRLTHRQGELLQIEASSLLRSCCRLFCATADDPSALGMGIDNIYSRGFCRPRMWDQYAMRHTGACLIFERARFDRQVRAVIPTGVQIHSGPVVYRNRSQVPYLGKPDAFMLNFDDVQSMSLPSAVQRHLEKFHNELFFEKATDWGDEKEIRWLLHLADDQDLYVPIGDSLVGIVITTDFSLENQQALGECARGRSIDIGELRWKNCSPEIVPSPLACVRAGSALGG